MTQNFELWITYEREIDPYTYYTVKNENLKCLPPPPLHDTF